ncbi:hypothetical protein GsuE55_18130 [Geobacillus subterraneus]|uniref:Uncharacterized protein n=1 Tax=Geobacillus subterraneus TaxID=129338 RepID=A0A679FM05_9BACL|nr:hypothetical protein GsuE55_18130 [Geobacillus subterraneus]
MDKTKLYPEAPLTSNQWGELDDHAPRSVRINQTNSAPNRHSSGTKRNIVCHTTDPWPLAP